MCQLLRGELDAGYRGMSTGLDYYPGQYCKTDELLALARVLKEFNAIYSTHVRIVQQGWDGYPFKGELCGIQEAIRIGRETGVKVHISHVLPYGYHVTEDFEARKALDAKVIRKMLEDALAEGIDITCDVMPGESGASYERVYLISYLLPWIKKAGGLEQFKEVLATDAFLARLRDDVNSLKELTLSMLWEPTLDDWILITHCSNKEYVGKTIREISRELGCDHLEAICVVLKADYYSRFYKRSGCVSPAFLKEMLAFPRSFPSCDSHSCEIGQIFGNDVILDPGPSWLTYNFAIRFIKEFGEARLEDTIHRMTAFPLSQHGVTDRGLIKEGLAADLVIFDESNLDVNQNTYGDMQSPLGIEMVFVNGECAFKDGKVTGSRTGELLTSSR
jgi:N-acyl-D-amino-acid deacylase